MLVGKWRLLKEWQQRERSCPKVPMGPLPLAKRLRPVKERPNFFQLYLSKDWSVNQAWLDEAVQAGVKAIILTVDSTLGGYREADIVNNFQFPLPMGNLAN